MLHLSFGIRAEGGLGFRDQLTGKKFGFRMCGFIRHGGVARRVCGLGRGVLGFGVEKGVIMSENNALSLILSKGFSRITAVVRTLLLRSLADNPHHFSLRPKLGMFPLMLTALNGDHYSTPTKIPIQDCLGGTSQA